VASRRGADELIASGAVRVNGRLAPPEGMLVDPDRDRIRVRGRDVKVPTGHRYLAFNKPKGVLVTARDTAGRPTVFDLLDDDATAGRRLVAVGRLDMDTTGLLLLTDDGELAQALAHPRHEVEKEYVAVVRGTPGEADLARLRSGVELEEGRTAPARVDLLRATGQFAEVRIVIHEGRNRQVRRMLEAVGHPVRELRRTSFGPVRLGRLKEGGYRVIRGPELEALRQAAGVVEAGRARPSARGRGTRSGSARVGRGRLAPTNR
jgi:pseudouridine synthase